MHRFVFALTIAALCLGSQAAMAAVSSENIGDAHVRLGTGQSQYNFGGDFDFSIVGADDDPYNSNGFLKFSGSDIKSKLVAEYGAGYSVTGITLSLWATGNNFFSAGGLEVFFSPDASWVEGTNYSSSQAGNPSDASYLTGDNYTGYITSLTSLGSFATSEAGVYGNGNGVEVPFALSTAQVLLDAIDAGSDFTLYLTPTTDGSALHYGARDSSWNPAPQLTVTGVPEPASLVLLGLGGVALLTARRRSA